MESILKSFREQGIMTEVKTMKHMVTDIPRDIKAIVSLVQNILLHQHWAKAYGVELNDERKREPWLRSFEEKLIFLNNRGYSHISDKKPIDNKMVGICRDFSVVTAALCREVGIPARARCGFSAYFEKGKYIDHWVAEYWNEDIKRWVMVDAQLDEFQQEKLNISFDPLDVSDEYFITGPRAWLMCREGKYNPELFGIFKWWGYCYLKTNLILDANSLLKVPMQPWDGWEGYMGSLVTDWSLKDYSIMDELAEAAANADDDLEPLYTFIEHNDKIKVPDDLDKVINYLA